MTDEARVKLYHKTTSVELYRVVDEFGLPYLNLAGEPVDGGGYSDPDDAHRQAKAINKANERLANDPDPDEGY